MRTPRDISGTRLSRALAQFGYAVTRQTGSHIRMTTQRGGEHHVTVPAHNPVKVGTLNAIIGDVAQHLKLTKEEVIKAIVA